MPFAASKGKYNWSHNKIDYLLSGNSLRCFACGSISRAAFRLRVLPFKRAWRPRSASLHRHPCQPLSHSAASLQSLRHGAPASNKPHLTEKSTPVWLAIWRTWAGFANSQHRDAAFATPNNICAHSFLLPHWAAAQTDANLSAHLHRLPTPPPYLRRMRLSPGQGRSCLVLDETYRLAGAQVSDGR